MAGGLALIAAGGAQAQPPAAKAPAPDRVYTRYSDGYCRAVLDFTRAGKATGSYGAATRLTP